jgi:hypothetical protein
MPSPGDKFKIKLDPECFEHRNEHFAGMNGKVVRLVAPAGKTLWQTDFFREEWRELQNDYVWDGFLLVQPDKDGRVVRR